MPTQNHCELYQSRYYKRAAIRVSDRLMKELVSRADTTRMPDNDSQVVSQEPIQFFQANVIATMIDSFLTSVEMQDPGMVAQCKAIIYGQPVPAGSKRAGNEQEVVLCTYCSKEVTEPYITEGDIYCSKECADEALQEDELSPDDVEQFRGQDVMVIDQDGGQYDGVLEVNGETYTVADLEFTFDDVDEVMEPEQEGVIPVITLGHGSDEME